MAKIVLSLDGVLIKEIKLNKERFTIGRRPSNDLQIDNLAVSGEHAVLIMQGSNVLIEDLNSTNGTKVNHQDIQKERLKEGDEILVGKHILRFYSEKPTENTDFEKTMMMGRPPVMAKPVPPPAPPVAADTPAPVAQAIADHPSPAAAPQPDSLIQQLGVIKVLSGANTGKELELNKKLTTLGKTGVQVAVITKRPQGYFLTHVEGAHHPTVNKKEIGVHAHLLQEKDIIELLGIEMTFFYRS
ncbi:FHA domain-containing protein [Iodobacter fluviatilis]|uniref:FHA domain-containing protein n=1 Tax=Iodobacter fluviatilis TaxID=537 RepID=A0A377SYT7_9NEIS|nr:FHA domain-containing protein [Iodobacter fluviatilis]TCU88178.1 FHA domain-containing protein [Iodobacter fluviatilis]STR45679.1 Probable regulatory protein embR [Iodobacter fluviatilis]